jgi:hypothetical protein
VATFIHNSNHAEALRRLDKTIAKCSNNNASPNQFKLIIIEDILTLPAIIGGNMSKGWIISASYSQASKKDSIPLLIAFSTVV